MGCWKGFVRFALLPFAVAIWLDGCSTTGPKSAHAEVRATSRTVLLTGFEPFGGRARNNSYEIAKRLRADPTLVGENVAIEICELPVEYDRGARIAESCFEGLQARGVKIDAVVSLGEGSCDIRLETAATNLDNAGSADNAGVLRQNHVIDSSLPARVGFTLAFDRAYHQRPFSETPIVPSISPGDYVCNNAAFLLGHYFKSKNIPFGFMHLPPEDCGGGSLPVWKDPRLVGALIGAAIAGPAIEWPIDLVSEQALEASAGAGAPAIDAEFLAELHKLYFSR